MLNAGALNSQTFKLSKDFGVREREGEREQFLQDAIANKLSHKQAYVCAIKMSSVRKNMKEEIAIKKNNTKF